jgi:uncharacterized protein YjiS (DUF1127 family)
MTFLRTTSSSGSFFALLGLFRTLLVSSRRAVESRLARDELMKLDDRLLKDIGLSREELRFGDVTVLAEQRRSHH